MDGLRVGAEGEEVAVLTEGQTVDVSTSLDSPPELHQSGAVLDTEYPDDCASLRGRGQLGPRRIEGDGCQGGIVSGNHQLGLQVECVKQLDFSCGCGARVGQETVVAVDAESAQSSRVWWGLSYRVENLHISDVVNIERLLQADHQPGPVELDSQDGVAVAVLTDLRPFLEVTNAQSPRRGLRDQSQQR